MNNICPMCEDIREIVIGSAFEETKVKGVSVTAESHFSRCTHCGEEFATAEQMHASLTNAYNEYRRIESLIYPEEIIAIRKKYNVGQKTFARILGFGELTINSYEQGKLPTKANSNIIKLVERTEDFVLLYNQCKHKLSSTQQNKIEEQLLKLSEDQNEWDREVEDVTRFLNTSPTGTSRVKKFSAALAASFLRQNETGGWIVRSASGQLSRNSTHTTKNDARQVADKKLRDVANREGNNTHPRGRK